MARLLNNKSTHVTEYKYVTNNNSKTDGHPQERVVLPLDKKNFILMAIAAFMIVVGFLLMLGGASTPEEFNPEIFSTRRIVVGPTLAFLGFVFMGFAIIYRPRKKKISE